MKGLVFVAAMALAAPAYAEDVTLKLTLKDHKFEPSEIEAPAGKPFVIEVSNQDPAAAEFESKELRVEKITPAGGKATVKVRALKPGRYKFFDENHEDTAQGVLIVK